MKRVILYCRVSTDEQTHGHSLDYQEMRLKEYCKFQQHEIVAIIKDNKSGQNFKRPGWKEIRFTMQSKK